MAHFVPVFIGTTPAGVEWWAYKPENVEPMRRRFAAISSPQSSISGEVKEIRRILNARSHGEAKDVERLSDTTIRYRARYAETVKNIAALAKAAGGTAEVAKVGKMKKTGTFGFTRPNSVTFSLSKKAIDFIMRAPGASEGKLYMGRRVK